MMPALPRCPTDLSDKLYAPLRQLADAWANCESRPIIPKEVEESWSVALRQWIDDETLPLLIRKPSIGRGCLISHASGRRLLPTDNSPALWSFSLALRGEIPTVEEFHQYLSSDQIPIAMILKTVERERATHKRMLGKAENLNVAGWKLAHIDPIGLRQRGELEKANIESLRLHFRRFMDPANMFLVPKAWAGLGEVPEMIDAIRSYRGANKMI